VVLSTAIYEQFSRSAIRKKLNLVKERISNRLSQKTKDLFRSSFEDILQGFSLTTKKKHRFYTWFY